MLLHELPHPDRPRERLLRQGAGALADAELLAIFLRTGTRGRSALDCARALLTRFGGLSGVLAAPRAELLAQPGMGPAKLCPLLAAVELGQRVLEQGLRDGEALTSPRACAAFLRARLRPLPYEVFGCLFLDNRHRVLAFEELFRGTIDGASVHPREVVRRALAHNAAALILAHNHPSGVAEPSAADLALTRRLAETMALIDVRVLDHFIVGDGEPVSFAERGLL